LTALQKDLSNVMGLSLVWTIAVLSLLCGSGTALKCYNCSDLYTQDQDSDRNCRLNTDSLATVECERPETAGPEQTPRCLTLIGTITASVDGVVVEQGNDVIRFCRWFGPDTPNKCIASDDDTPLKEVSFDDGPIEEKYDLYKICVCDQDGCNGEAVADGSTRLAAWPLAFFMSTAAVLAVLESILL
jgi:hypothetical protein